MSMRETMCRGHFRQYVKNGKTTVYCGVGFSEILDVDIFYFFRLLIKGVLWYLSLRVAVLAATDF